MALTITVAELAAALRLGDSAEEMAEVSRLRTYASLAVERAAPRAPNSVHTEAAIRLAGYIFDQPFAGKGAAYANALRNSGAAAILFPYVDHRGGSTAPLIEPVVERAVAD